MTREVNEKKISRIQQKNRDKIFEAALDIFSSHGFRGTTLDSIAEAAHMSKPNLLYYFESKEAIYSDLMEHLLHNWLDPLSLVKTDGDPIEELLGYIRQKLRLSEKFPRESRLFANEIIRGAPILSDYLGGTLKEIVEEKTGLIRTWSALGKINKIDPYHFLFSVWATTQHYADFETQMVALVGEKNRFEEGEKYLMHMYRTLLTPI